MFGGAYITFIDPDDWVESDYLEVLYRALIDEKADIAISTYKQFNMDDNCYYMHVWDNDYYEKQWLSHELLSQLPSLELNDYSYTVSWGKLFKSSIFDQIKFNEQRRFGEDFECSFKLYLTMKSCLYIHKALYTYRVYSESMVGKVRTERQLMDDVEIRLGRIPFLIGREIDPTPYI